MDQPGRTHHYSTLSSRSFRRTRLITFMVIPVTQSNHPARWWTPLPDGRIECRACPRLCKLQAGQRGFCFVRQNVGGRMVLTTYGRSSGFCVDPIEKKPLNHFYPGTSVLSFGCLLYTSDAADEEDSVDRGG